MAHCLAHANWVQEKQHARDDKANLKTGPQRVGCQHAATGQRLAYPMSSLAGMTGGDCDPDCLLQANAGPLEFLKRKTTSSPATEPVFLTVTDACSTGTGQHVTCVLCCNIWKQPKLIVRLENGKARVLCF